LVRQRNPELVWARHHLAVLPVEHLLFGLFFSGSGVKELYRFVWCVDFLFRPFPGFHASPSRFKSFWTHTPSVELRFAEEVEHQLLPLARLVRTIDDVRRMTHERFWAIEPIDRWLEGDVAVLAAMGDMAGARKVAERLMTDETSWTRAWDDRSLSIRSRTELCPAILADDRATVARLLHEDEELIAKAWRLDKVWRPSPFPLELM
jgi:hypothetical protein